MNPFIKILFVITLFCSTHSDAQRQTAKQPAKTNELKLPPVKLKSRNDSLQYALGLYMGKLLLQGGFVSIDANLFLTGIDDMFSNNPKLVKDTVAVAMVDEYQSSIQKQRGRLLEDQLFAALKDNPSVGKLPGGVQYIILKPGDGIRPAATDSIRIHFKGTLPNGAVFENTFIQNRQPVITTPSSMIPGMNQVLQIMPQGSTWEVFIPSALAYGEQGNGKIVPANSALLVTVELLEVKPKK